METNKKDGISLSITRTGLNRLISKSAKIRARRKQFKDSSDPFGEILIYFTNYVLKNSLDKGIQTTFGAQWPAVYEFWTEERIDIFIHESRQFYHYRRFTYREREELSAVLFLSPAVAEVLNWFDEFREVESVK